MGKGIGALRRAAKLNSFLSLLVFIVVEAPDEQRRAQPGVLRRAARIENGLRALADKRLVAKGGRILTSRLDDETALRRLVTFAFVLLRRSYGCVEWEPQLL
jgi:hypothetical protein